MYIKIGRMRLSVRLILLAAIMIVALIDRLLPSSTLLMALLAIYTLIDFKSIIISIRRLRYWCFFWLYAIGITLVSFLNRNEFVIGDLFLVIRIGLLVILGYSFSITTTVSERYLLYKMLAAIIGITILFGFWQFISGTTQYSDPNRMNSIYGHPIVYCAVLTGFFWIVRGVCKNFALRVFLQALAIIAMLTTMSRSGWIACVVSVFMNFILMRRDKRMTAKRVAQGVFVFIMVIGVIILLHEFLLQMVGMITDRFENLLDNVSATQRLGAIAYIATSYVNEADYLGLLLGHGTGMAGSKIASVNIVIQGFTTVDNQYVTILYDYGIIGFFIVVQFIIYTLKNMYKFKSRSGEIVMLGNVIFSLLVSAFFYEMLGWINVSIIFLVFAGIFCGVVAMRSPNDSSKV